jgi:hypothetical protein
MNGVDPFIPDMRLCRNTIKAGTIGGAPSPWDFLGPRAVDQLDIELLASAGECDAVFWRAVKKTVLGTTRTGPPYPGRYRQQAFHVLSAMRSPEGRQPLGEVAGRTAESPKAN